jgi:hypothetical protein
MGYGEFIGEQRTFIPRTLYELVLVRKMIAEDLRHGSLCDMLHPRFHGNDTKSTRTKCYHLCCFEGFSNISEDDPNVKITKQKIDKHFTKRLSLSEQQFTATQIMDMTNEHLEYLKQIYKEAQEDLKQGKETVSSCSTPGPTSCFRYHSFRGSCRPMGIACESEAEIVRNAIRLECSVADDDVIFYRGSRFDLDNVNIITIEGKEIPYSLSFGSGLFTGCVFDPGATPFSFMKVAENNAYAIVVQKSKLSTSPFFNPPTGIIPQMYGMGESFHPRTKGWKDCPVNEIRGINISFSLKDRPREHLSSDISKEELIEMFCLFKNGAVQLK